MEGWRHGTKKEWQTPLLAILLSSNGHIYRRHVLGIINPCGRRQLFYFAVARIGCGQRVVLSDTLLYPYLFPIHDIDALLHLLQALAREVINGILIYIFQF